MKRPHIMLKDVDSLTIDVSSETVSVKYTVEHGDDFAEMEEEMESDKLSARLNRKIHTLLVSVLDEMNQKARSEEDIPCHTCIGACCTDSFSAVHLTREDIDRLVRSPNYQDGSVATFKLQSWTGYVGKLSRVTVAKAVDPPTGLPAIREICVYLRSNGCAIYEDRPSICRQYSPWHCGEVYEEDPTKVASRKKGRVTLRVVR